VATAEVFAAVGAPDTGPEMSKRVWPSVVLLNVYADVPAVDGKADVVVVIVVAVPVVV